MSSSWPRPSSILTRPTKNYSLLTPTSATWLKVSLMGPPKRSPGLALSKSILFWRSRTSSLWSPLAGPTMDSLDLRDPTTAQSVPTIAMADKSQKITTRLASMLEFRSLESTQRSCPDSGNSRLVPASELRPLIKFGWPGIF